MLNYTKHTLAKVEALLTDQKYVVRYEKGSFISGYCIVENRKIAILNKFFDTPARMNCLLDILTSINIDESLYGEKQLAFYKQAMKHLLALDKDTPFDKDSEKKEEELLAATA